MAHHLPDLIIPKIHFVTEYLITINVNGPATRFWSFTLAKRHQLRQCLMLSNKNDYNICTEITLLKTIQYSSLPIPVQRLLTENDINQNIFDECKTIYYKNVMMMRQSVFVERLVDVEEEPCFVSILYFLKIQNIWKAIVEHLQVIGFNETLWAYEIEFCKTLDLLDLDQLLHILPHGLDIYYVQGSAYVNFYLV
ncbi:unnamed protein product [Adineta steineri]|uniref:Uncharacterized protein n=1 Tax=Adineta steineri TaxID=433720 RepID=A0A815Q0Q3_9BILA|nr:unnamed protein product [Adineta steineri]CAF1631856.1 unnamed protein product [Adineta steineri]